MIATVGLESRRATVVRSTEGPSPPFPLPDLRLAQGRRGRSVAPVPNDDHVSSRVLSVSLLATAFGVTFGNEEEMAENPLVDRNGAFIEDRLTELDALIAEWDES